ncbi:MAG: hypothetical protein AB8G11_13945 [Saprospiraceae bacterium]
MKKLYDIRINPEKPSSEEVAKHMDFDALLQQFEAEEKEQPKVVQMRRRPIRRWALVAASFALVVMVTFAIQQTFFKSNNVEQIARPFINPPIKTVQKSFATFEVEAQKGGEFVMEDGTKIFVPKDAFTNTSGAMIMGTVILKYRKYQDIEEIFLSGIPMQYDSANVRFDMASVGMMELAGVYKNEIIEIRPNKSLTVELVAQTDLDKIQDYNVYQLDTIAKNWKYVALDDLTIDLDKATSKRIDAALAESEIVKKIALAYSELKELKATKTKKSQQTTNLLPQKPTPPKRPNGEDFVLDFDLSAFTNTEDDEFGDNFEGTDSSEVIEQAPYKGEDLTKYANVMWEVSADQKTAYEKAISSIVWRTVELYKIDNQNFSLKLKTGQTKVELMVSPVLSGRELDKAEAKYRKELETYNALIAEYQQNSEPETNEIDTEYDAKVKSLEQEIATLQRAYNKARIAMMREMDLNLKNQTIVNRFNVSEFGIWNCDKPEPAKKRTVSANFQDKNGSAIDYYMVYVADKTNGRVQRFYTNQKTKITYNPNAENVLWLVSKKGKIAVAKATEFTKIGNENQFTFTLNKLSQQVDSKEDVKQILGL